MEVTCFNSTLVRLIALTAGTALDITGFQFHFGTIDSQLSKSTDAVLRCFNSTLVRLIATAFLIANLIPAFQFHFGTIDSLYRILLSFFF